MIANEGYEATLHCHTCRQAVRAVMNDFMILMMKPTHNTVCWYEYASAAVTLRCGVLRPLKSFLEGDCLSNRYYASAVRHKSKDSHRSQGESIYLPMNSMLLASGTKREIGFAAKERVFISLQKVRFCYQA